MAQPTIDTLTLNSGSGGSDLAGDTVASKFWQATLVGYSTGDGAANVVMADTGLPVVAATGATWACTQSGTWNVGTVTTVTTVTSVTDLAKLGGQAVSMGTGVRDAGTQRVTVSTDDVVPVSQSGTWNVGTVTTVTSVTDLAKLGGQSVSMGTGVRDAGTQRVTVATDDVVPVSQSGTWNVGTVTTVTSVTDLAKLGGQSVSMGTGVRDAGTQRVTVATDDVVPVVPAVQTDFVYDGDTKCTIKRITGLAASGTVNMIAAVGTKKFRVFSLALIATSATVTNVYVHNDDNDILGDSSNPIPLATDADGDNMAGFILPWNPGGWFDTDAVNENLSVTLSAAQDVIYAVTYAEVA